jgi:glycosyltransferase involved in cell wall biosynthesis
LVSSYCTNFAEYAAGYGLGWLAPAIWALLRHFHAPSLVTYCPSEATRRDLRARGFAEDLQLWPRGVDAELFDPRRRSEDVRARLAPGARVVLTYVGRIAPEKRLDLLLDAWPVIREGATRPVALVLVGHGPALQALQARAPEGVHFTGFLHGEELATAYASSDLFVFPSDTETFGQVVTEAFASGLPVVAPARGGVVDLIRPEVTGLLFEPGDASGFATAALRLIEDDELRARLGGMARNDALGRSWDDVFERLFASYEELLPSSDETVTRTSAYGAAGRPRFRTSGDIGRPL